MTDKEMEICVTILPPLESIANRLGKSPDGILLNAAIKQLRKILSGDKK